MKNHQNHEPTQLHRQTGRKPAAKLQNNGKTVDCALPWDIGHGGDHDLDELFAWMKQVSSSAK